MTEFLSNLYLHLNLIESIGPGLITRLHSHLLPEQLHQLYDFSAHDLMAFGISLSNAEKIVAGLADEQLLAQELTLLEQHKISYVSIADAEYPPLLKTIHAPPPILYYKGALPGEQSIAVVGSRDANAYGKEVIGMLVPPLVNQGWTIISGGARGADTMAHKTALAVGGTTVAVLGSGLLEIYPPENITMFQAMVAQGGALISPFALTMPPLPKNFPARNRIIAGLSRGCVVIQAAAKSGAKITADFCLSQGREVFAVPGSITDPLSAGCHALLAQGAKVTGSAADILQEFGQAVEPAQLELPFVRENSDFLPASKSIPGLRMTELERTIWQACTQPVCMDQLLEVTTLPLVSLTPLLFDMQLKGLVFQTMNGMWQKRES